MRKPAAIAAQKASAPAGRWNNTPTEVVCLALTVALVALAARIVSIW